MPEAFSMTERDSSNLDPSRSEPALTGSLEPRSEAIKLVTLAPPSSLPEGQALEGALDGTRFGDAPSSKELPTAQRDAYLGCTVDGRYRIEAVVGEGGMGVVYRCTHEVIGKKVAMKLLRADLARDAEVTERFLNEAKSASAIGNPHIIDISDFGRLPDGSTYFVMEYLEGVPLSELIEQGPIPVRRIVHIARQLAEGLSAAHRAGIIHRDLKPDNIYLIARGSDSDFVKILDFGIAKVSHNESKLTRAGAVFGTPHYMSPEQAAGSTVDHRGDVYAVGVILYEMASGRVPFDADNFMGILTQHMYKAPVPIRALVPEPQKVPPGLEAIILKCLSKRPEQRYASMDELSRDLHELETGKVPDAVGEMMDRSGGFNVPADYFKARALSASLRLAPDSGRRRLPVYAAAAGALIAVVTIGAILAQSSDGSASPPAQPVAAAAAPPPKPTAVVEKTPTRLQVVLAVEPLDARVLRGSEDLGTSPVVVSVDPEAPVELTIRRDDYVSQSVRVDGSQPKLSIKLEPVAPPKKPTAPRRPKPAAASGAKKPAIGAGDIGIVDPWK